MLSIALHNAGRTGGAYSRCLRARRRPIVCPPRRAEPDVGRTWSPGLSGATGPWLQVSQQPSAERHAERWGSQRATPMSVQGLLGLGLDRSRRLGHADFLRNELCVRMGNCIRELLSLPHDLASRPGIQTVLQRYCSSIGDLEHTPGLGAGEGGAAFAQLLSAVFERHTEDITSLAWALQSWSAELGGGSSTLQSSADDRLRGFCAQRIGLRLLLKHYVDAHRQNKPSFSGVFQLDCCPVSAAQQAASASSTLCKMALFQAPAILVQDAAQGAGRLAYVPPHLQYVLTELLKNACRAVVEAHGHGFDDELPAVRCHVERSAEHVVWRIGDEGGGIPKDRAKDVWRFMYTTSPRSPWDVEDEMSLAGRHRGRRAVASPPPPRRRNALAGFGFGLALSRLYAGHFGGDLKLASLPGRGTTATLHIPHSGLRMERLPR